MNLTYGSVCSGIESASVAWEPLGMQTKWFSEIEPFPCAVLAHHWPHVPNLGDMTALPEMVRRKEICAPDILVGGTPCQAFSIAGKQLSMADARGQLTLIYGDLLNAIDDTRSKEGLDSAIAVWENVPGVLSTADNAFGWFLGLLAGELTLADCLSGTAQPLEAQPCASRQKWPKSGCVIGPIRTVAWRILDAQYFGVAQRRRRVFVVASARAGFDPAKVLFECEGVRRDIAPSRKAREEVAGNVGKGSHWDNPVNPHPTLNQSVLDGHVQVGYRMVAFGEYADDDTASTMKARDYKDATDLCLSVHGTQDPCVSNNLAFALGCNGGAENAVFGIPGNWIGRKPENGGNAVEPMNNISPCQTVTDRHTVAYVLPINTMTVQGRPSDDLNPRMGSGIGHPSDPQNTLTKAHMHGVFDSANMCVRRLTPTECERLQGFPDGHTNIPNAADGNRYKALGNSKAVPVVQWIGKRIIGQLRKSA